MNLLFVGSTSGTSSSLHYFTNFVRLGHRVLPFDPGYFETSGFLERLEVRVRKSPPPRKVRRVSDALVRLCRDNSFDAVFVMGENFLGAETMEEIRKSPKRAPLFLFHSHDNLFAPGILKAEDFERALAAYDFAFTTKSQNVSRYRELGANAIYLPSAYEPTVHRPIPPGESRLNAELDVTFVGTFDRSRIPTLHAAGWDRLHVWGNDWQRFADYERYRDRITPRAIYYFELADVLSRSRCALGLLREEAEDRHTQRTFEIPASGALQIAPRNEEIQGFFKENEEIVLFGSGDELKEKIDYYLARPDERQKIASKGRERCERDHHTYADRCESILKAAFGSKRASQLANY